MKTTIDLDHELFLQVLQNAAQSNRTLTAVVEDALRQYLEQQHKVDQKPIRLKTVHGFGLNPGVILSNSSQLMDTMDNVDDSD